MLHIAVGYIFCRNTKPSNIELRFIASKITGSRSFTQYILHPNSFKAMIAMLWTYVRVNNFAFRHRAFEMLYREHLQNVKWVKG